MMIFRSTFAILLCGSLLAATGMPAAADNGVPWNRLSDTEQEALRKYRRSWSDMERGQQQRLREGARDYLSLPPDKREAVRRKRDEYERMSPEERKRLRKQYKRERR